MHLFVFGLGYSALHFIRSHATHFQSVCGTVRTDEKQQLLRAEGIEALVCNDGFCDAAVATHLARSDLLLVSVPPGADGDPVLNAYASAIAEGGIRRIVYLSTVGVYGDHAGAWIDETAETVADGTRRGRRAAAEVAWREIRGDRTSVLRLAGIYGPGRNALVNLRAGKAHRIVKQGQVFNRIHVDDIGHAIAAAFACRDVGIWNVSDDEPAPPQDVIAFAARLMEIDPPAEQDFADAGMTAMARSFYATNNRISNARLKRDLEIALAFPNYRDGLTALWKISEKDAIA